MLRRCSEQLSGRVPKVPGCHGLVFFFLGGAFARGSLDINPFFLPSSFLFAFDMSFLSFSLSSFFLMAAAPFQVHADRHGLLGVLGHRGHPHRRSPAAADVLAAELRGARRPFLDGERACRAWFFPPGPVFSGFKGKPKGHRPETSPHSEFLNLGLGFLGSNFASTRWANPRGHGITCSFQAGNG